VLKNTKKAPIQQPRNSRMRVVRATI
jgi:hypothetical protein